MNKLNIIWGTTWAQSVLVGFLNIDLSPVAGGISKILGLIGGILLILNQYEAWKGKRSANEKVDRENYEAWERKAAELNKEKKERKNK